MSTKKVLLTGVTYTAIAKYAGIVISLVVTGILSRLLSPDDFGVVAIATVIITFFATFSDLGIGPAIIQNKDLNKEDISNIFSFTVWLSIILAFCFFAASWLIAGYYKSDILVSICQLLSINLFFVSLNIVPNALLYKDKRFKFVAYRSLVIQMISGVLAVLAALYGLGLYSLLINPIFSSIGIFIVNIIQYPQRFKLTFKLDAIKKIFSFSVYQLSFNIINYFSRNLDKLMIGRYMGFSALGYYEKSYRLMMLPLQNITAVITPVMHPVFAEYQNDINYLRTAYMKVVRILAFIGFPATVYLAFSARELVLIVFGEQWMASVPVFQILAISVGVQIILSTTGAIFQAANATKMLFISGCISTLFVVSGLLVGIFVFGSLEAIAWSITITFTINFVQAYFLMFRYTFRSAFFPFWKQLASPFILTLIIGGIMCGILYLLPTISNIFISLALKSAITILTIIIYIQTTKEYNIIHKISSMVKKK